MPAKLFLLIIATLCLLPVVSPAEAQTAQTPKIRVACVGDSITAGTVLPKPQENSYPAVLGRLLGEKYDVKNFGRSATTVLSGPGTYCYRTVPEYQQACQFQPDLVLIMLGTNDTKTAIWKSHDRFAQEYQTLLESFQKLNHNPVIFVCLPVPVFGKGAYTINEPNRQEMLPLIQTVVAATKVKLIDTNKPLRDHPEWFPDTVHPNLEGTQALAKLIAAELTPPASQPTP